MTFQHSTWQVQRPSSRNLKDRLGIARYNIELLEWCFKKKKKKRRRHFEVSSFYRIFPVRSEVSLSSLTKEISNSRGAVIRKRTVMAILFLFPLLHSKCEKHPISLGSRDAGDSEYMQKGSLLADPGWWWVLGGAGWGLWDRLGTLHPSTHA